jgi:hypothetical protein
VAGVMTRRGAVKPPLYEIFDIPPSGTQPHRFYIALIRAQLVGNSYPHADLGFHNIFKDGATDFHEPMSDPDRLQKVVLFTFPSPGFSVVGKDSSSAALTQMSVSKKLEFCMKQLGAAFYKILPDEIRDKYNLRMVTILASGAGGGDQVTHVDYEKESLVMICPISTSPTKIIVNHTATRWFLRFATSRYFTIPSSLCDQETLVVNADQFLLFSYALAHCGSSYTDLNYRFHCVFFPKKVELPKDSTYIMNHHHTWMLQWDSAGEAEKRQEYEKKLRQYDSLLENERSSKKAKN